MGRNPVFDKTRARIQETVSEAAKRETGPLVTVLWTIAGLLGLLFLALVNHAR